MKTKSKEFYASDNESKIKALADLLNVEFITETEKQENCDDPYCTGHKTTKIYAVIKK